MLFERVAIVGVGLIGGSFALALKKANACRHVVGVGRGAANLKLATERGVIDSIAPDAAAAARGADLVLVATPLAQFKTVFAQMGSSIGAGALITDAGSTKQDVISAAREALKQKIAQFVPSHPIAGAEHSGAAAANAELFRGRRVVLTPLAENAAASVQRITDAWRECGARVSSMSAQEHDAVLAAVSHLPHLIAFALVHEMAGREDSAELFSYAAGGFRDFTRIASSHPEMWRDICMANRERVLNELSRFTDKLGEVKRLLEKSDAGALEKLFTQAREARGRWLAGEFDA
jgi:prephenate dehydrogenase